MTETDRVERSPVDVLRLVVAAVVLLLLLLVEWLFGDTLVTFASEVFAGLSAIPQWILATVVIGTRILAIVIFGGGLVWALYRRDRRLLVTVAVAGVAAAGLALLLGGLVDTDQGAVVVGLDADLRPLTRDGFPSMAGLAVAAGILTAAAPWLSRRWRRWTWALVIGLVVVAFLDSPVSFDTSLALVSGWVAGAATLVAMGAPSRRPTRQAVIAGLTGVGLPLSRLDQAKVDARGSTPYFGELTDGGNVFVKALGQDQRSADLLFRLYRGILPRQLGDERPFSSLRRGVEHEALVALAARDLGVKTPRLRAFANVEPNGFVLAYEAIEGRSLDRLEADEVTDDILAATWTLVGQLRSHRIAHRDLRLANIFVDDTSAVWLIDFGFSELAATDLLLANDVAELLASSSVVVGAERAAAQAIAAVDPLTLSHTLERLQPWALSGATRTALKAAPGLLDDLRHRVTAAAAVDRP